MSALVLDHVALHVTDVERSLGFYRDALGWRELPRPAFDFPGAWLAIGEHYELHLIGGKQLPDPLPVFGHYAMRTADIQGIAERLRAAGLEFRGPNPRPDGWLQIFVRDPDGHLIEFNQPPA